MYRNRLSCGLLLCAIIIAGCKNESILSPLSQITVSGKIYNQYHQALPNLKVKIEEQSAVTSFDGSFLISNVISPYDLVVHDSLNKYGYFIPGLTISNPELNLMNPSSYPRECVVNVNIPSAIAFSHGKIIFTDTNDMNFYSDVTEHNSVLNINMKDDNPVTGKLVVLLYSENIGHIISYDKFGFKDNITITKGGNITVNFLASDLYLNPGETYNNINVYPKYSKNNRTFFICFGKKIYQNFSGITAFENEYEVNMDFYTPSGLPLNYSTLFCMDGNIDTLNFTGYYKEQFLIPAGIWGLHLDVDGPPTLGHPLNYEEGIDLNTIFNFNSGIYNGIFDVYLSDSVSNYTYYYFTSQFTFDLKWISKIHNADISNRNFRWTAESLSPSFCSMDDYLNPGRSNIISFNSSCYIYHFKTK